MVPAFIISLPIISIPTNRFISPSSRSNFQVAGRANIFRSPCYNFSMSASPTTLTNFTVTKKNGVCLSCILDPVTSNQEAPLYVLVHGYRDSKKGRFMMKLVNELSSRGVRTARFDTTGNGQSAGDFTYADYFGEAEDLRDVIQHLTNSMGLKVDGIVGHSKGAGVVLIYAQKYGDVSLVVPLAPRYRMKTGIVERFGTDLLNECRQNGSVEITDRDGFKFALTKASLEERESMDMGVIARGIQPQTRVVLVHGDADTTIPVIDADEFDRDLDHLEKIIIPGADHGFRGKEVEVVDAFCS